MKANKRKFMYGVMLAILLLVVFGLYFLGLREAQYHCIICGSKKHVEILRLPGWYALPEMYRTEKITTTLSPFYKDFLADSDHHHQWDCDWRASRYFGQTYTGSEMNPNDLVSFYNSKPEFRKYIQQLLKDGEYSHKQIADIAQLENQARAEFLIKDFMLETHFINKAEN